MLELLILERPLASFTYWMVKGIYTFLAKVYNIMLSLTSAGSEAGDINFFYMSDIATTMYTVAGVFMLFKVTITAINMIIDPDKVSDKNAGAGKLLTRIVTSLVMLIIFVPNGFIFDGETGILVRLERALLSEDGLINNVLPSSMDMEGKSSIADLVAEDVSAAVEKLDCYYYYRAEIPQTKLYESHGVTASKNVIDANKGFYHIRFYNASENNSGSVNAKDLCLPKTFSTDCSKYSYEIIKDSDIYFDLSDNELRASAFKNGWTNSCPHIISKTNITYVETLYDAKTGKVDSWKKAAASGILGGWHSEASMIAALKGANVTSQGIGDNVKKMEEATGIKEDTVVNGNALYGYLNEGGFDYGALQFSQMSMGTFLSCNDFDNCEEHKSVALSSAAADDQIVEDLANNSMDLDFFPALIAGIGMIIWVLVLCIDVIVRRLKLLLLQMIAPLPIISYSDPSDKMFGAWSKMYVSTYIDLFINLIAISFATYLLKMLNANRPEGLLLTFFYIIAVLIFAKAIPNIISKVFGIEGLGGSFKDIMGMTKKTLGFGAKAAGTLAGAGLGAAIGFATAERGLGSKLLSAGKGLFRGAGAGLKKNITGGASSMAAENERRNVLAEQGFGAGAILKESFRNKLGLSGKYEKSKKEKGLHDNYLNMAKAEEDAGLKALEQVIGLNKANNVGSVKDVVDARNDVAEAVREGKVSRYNFKNNNDGTITLTNKLTNQTDTIKNSEITEYYKKNGEAFMSVEEAKSRIYSLERKAAAELTNIAVSGDEKRIKEAGLDAAGTATTLANAYAATNAAAEKAGQNLEQFAAEKGININTLEGVEKARKERLKDSKVKSQMAQVAMEESELLSDFVNNNGK